MKKSIPSVQKGSILVSILIVMIFLTSFVFSFLLLANSNLSRARGRILLLQAQYAAESGADQAIAILNGGNDAYTGTASDISLVTNSNLYRASYSVSVAPGSDAKERRIIAVGKVYTPATAAVPSYTRTIEVYANRTSTMTAPSMLSRNIIQTGSSVKDVKARDVYVNNYIRMESNVNNLIAENITVAGRDTSAGNCSIGGSGNLIKPVSFTNPAQTKTKILAAYNNCVNPPGSTSNANFDVSVNQQNIGKVQSTYIPWSQFMGTTPSAGSCNEWNNATPSVAGHYPDSSSNVAVGCGTNGSVNLGTKTVLITDNVHLRANLCSSSICRPIFHNISGSLKFIFIEGSVNFQQLRTSPGSAPIVFVVYGADPGINASCPIGDSIYIGQQGSDNTNAKAAYLLANNGVCLDKTKFDAAPALGGVAGKNIYIATNSGTPFDLTMDVTYPTSQIPIDLSWKASRYQRK